MIGLVLCYGCYKGTNLSTINYYRNPFYSYNYSTVLYELRLIEMLTFSRLHEYCWLDVLVVTAVCYSYFKSVMGLTYMNDSFHLL